MKTFLTRLCAVVAPFALVMCALTYAAYKTEMRALEQDLTLPEGVEAAVVGDSRVEVYFDPEELPWLRNFGLSATPFPIVAQKARLIAKQNPDIKLLIIDVWPAKLFQRLDVPFAVSERAAPYSIALLELYTRDDMPPFGDGFDVRLVNGVLVPGLRKLLGLPGAEHCPLTGQYLPNHKFLPTGENTPFGPPRTPAGLPATPTDAEIVLDHLLADLTAQGVKVVLTTTPLLGYERRWTAEAREYFEQRMAALAQKYGVAWYNWMHEYQNEPQYWADGMHLNDIGAKVFSRDKKQLLASHLR